MKTRHRSIAIAAWLVEFGLGGLFLYLGASKFFETGALALTRVGMALAEMIVGILILTRVSDTLSTLGVFGVAAAEVAFFSRPPIAAIACVSAHVLTARLRRDEGDNADKSESTRSYSPH